MRWFVRIFDYAGNSAADLAVWKLARLAVVVNAPADPARNIADFCEVERTFPAEALDLAVWRRVLRVHQWLKNLLLFVPIFAAHQLTSPDTWAVLILAFFSFSLCASSVYIQGCSTLVDSGRKVQFLSWYLLCSR